MSISELPQAYSYSSAIGYSSVESNTEASDANNQQDEKVENEESGKILDVTV